MGLLVVAALLCLGLSCACAEDLSGWKVVRATISKGEDLRLLQGWDLDVWSHESNLILGENDIRVNAAHLVSLAKMNIDYRVWIEDVEEMLTQSAKSYVNETAADWFASYHKYEDFTAYLDNVTASYPNLVKKTNVGQSIQGRNIDAVTITGTATGSKKKILFTGGQHAREWIGPHTVAYIITQLVSLYASDPSVKAILDQIQFYIIPIVNPDGYAYTWTGSSARLWRKNRRANTGGTYGVDLNRNWDDHWGGDGSSGTPSSDTYRGTAAFSEPETKVTSVYILQNGPFSGYIDFHSYSQLVLRPYGWTRTLPTNSATQKAVGDQISKVILGVNGKSYTSEPSNQLYLTSGSSDDWAYSKAGVPLSYTIELRDTGTYGFELPANQIIPTGQEIWAAVKYFAQYVISN